MNSVLPSAPPSMQAKQKRSSSIRSSTSPPSRTRRQAFIAGVQTAPSASRQMPSPPSPSSAHTRRFDSPPSAAMSNAVSRPVKDSATISVELSGVTTIPLGNAMPSATWRTEPSGRDQRDDPGGELRAGHEVEVDAVHVDVAAPSTTISFQPCPRGG